MRRDLGHFCTAVLVTSWLAGGCAGGSQSAPAPPPPAPASSASGEPGGASAAPLPVVESPDASPSAGATAAAPNPGGQASRSPRSVLELKDTFFLLNFDESDAKKAAEPGCSKAAGKNRKVLSSCFEKAREHIEIGGYRFEQDKAETYWCTVVRQRGAVVVTLHKFRYTYGAETDSSVTINPEGKDSGSKAWKQLPASLKFEVPTEYRIVVNDPAQGKLVYEAKSGVVGVK